MRRCVLLTCGVLLAAGSVPWAQEKTVGREKALAMIEKLGGRIDYDEKNPKQVFAVGWSFARLTDADLALLKEIPEVQRLYLGMTKVTDKGMHHLVTLKNLKVLDVTNTPIGDGGVKELKRLSGLERLWIRGSRITDMGVKELRAALPSLDIRR